MNITVDLCCAQLTFSSDTALSALSSGRDIIVHTDGKDYFIPGGSVSNVSAEPASGDDVVGTAIVGISKVH